MNEAKQADSTDVRLYQNIGYSYLEEQNYPAALAKYTAAVRLDPTAKTSFYGLGKTYYLLKQYPEAIHAFDQAIKLDPTTPLPMRTGQQLSTKCMTSPVAAPICSAARS